MKRAASNHSRPFSFQGTSPHDSKGVASFPGTSPPNSKGVAFIVECAQSHSRHAQSHSGRAQSHSRRLPERTGIRHRVFLLTGKSSSLIVMWATVFCVRRLWEGRNTSLRSCFCPEQEEHTSLRACFCPERTCLLLNIGDVDGWGCGEKLFCVGVVEDGGGVGA